MVLAAYCCCCSQVVQEFLDGIWIGRTVRHCQMYPLFVFDRTENNNDGHNNSTVGFIVCSGKSVSRRYGTAPGHPDSPAGAAQ